MFTFFALANAKAHAYSPNWSNDFSYLQKNYSQMRSFENYLFAPHLEEEDEYIKTTHLSTHAALILKDGKIIYEKYAKGYTKNHPQKLWSISKSITNLLVAIAVKEGRISLQDNVCPYFKEYKINFDCTKMTVEHLLGWSSGLHWREIFTQPLDSSVFNMLYNKAGYKDITSFILSHSVVTSPGSSWHYSSADTNLLMAILSKVYSSEQYARLPWLKLFDELGVQKAIWERDHKGVFLGCCSLYLTARDLARIGEFMLNQGRWLGKTFFPKNWIKNYVQAISPSFLKNPILIREQFVPSFHWWVNQPSRHADVLKPRALQTAPSDSYLAVGYSGQLLVIIPSMNTVIVRMGPTQGVYIDTNAVVGLALGVITGKQYVYPVRSTFVPFSIGEEYALPRKYDLNSLEVMNNFIAKEMCNCIFVEKQNEAICKNKLSPFLKKMQWLSVRKNSVKASVFGFASGRAASVGKYGCTLH